MSSLWEATRTSDLVMGLPKVYDVRFRLGEERSTDDFSGDTVFSGPVPPDAAGRTASLLPSFLGTRLQTPPDISAVRVNGERAHRIARSGESPAISPRPVHISSIRLTEEDGVDRSFALRLRCRKGTYVRSIVRDIGRALGCGAYVLSLVRRSIGPSGRTKPLPLKARVGRSGFFKGDQAPFRTGSPVLLLLLPFPGRTPTFSLERPCPFGPGHALSRRRGSGGQGRRPGERVFSFGNLLPGGLSTNPG